MATPMRSNSQDASHRARVADPRTTTAKADTQASNFEYDDNEWDIGIGNLIIDLDADIEKTNEGGAGAAGSAAAAASMATNASPAGSGKTAAKMAIEHSATVDKGLKMKIKRTKPGTKTSEAKHEIVKSNEQNGNADGTEMKGNSKHPVPSTIPTSSLNSSNSNSSSSNSSSGSNNSGSSSGSSNSSSTSGGGGGGNNISTSNSGNSGGGSGNSASGSGNSGGSNSSSGSSSSKRGSSGHRRDKTRDKHASDKPSPKVVVQQTSAQTVAEVNGVVRMSASQSGPQRPLFPSSTGPGPPAVPSSTGLAAAGPPSSPAAGVPVSISASSVNKLEPTKAIIAPVLQVVSSDDRCSSPPPAKKLKTESKEVADVCVGTSIGTITEPDCLGPCEPGTSVTLEGIVWHETEGGVLVVNVTWRGKTYVGTLLDCTRHDWAPPRFCDSPTSDLDSRTPKGRGKRGRAAGSSPSTDLSNFTETRSSVHSKLRNGGIKGRRGAANGSGPSTAPSSPTPFVPPRPEPNNKRKSRTSEEETPNNSVNSSGGGGGGSGSGGGGSGGGGGGGTGKKSKITPVSNPNSSCGSPPPSPILLECPEPNCSKKYKHINGLKYHQSHAHGSADDDDTKDVTSMSENDESNIEAPSPVTPVKSPDKSQDSPLTPQKKDELPLVLRGSGLLEVPSQPATPRSTPPSPGTPQSIQDIGTSTSVRSPSVPLVDSKNVVKPGVLRYNAATAEEFPMGVFGNKPHVPGTNVRSVNVTLAEQSVGAQQSAPEGLQSFANQIQPPQQPNLEQPSPMLLIPNQNPQTQTQPQQPQAQQTNAPNTQQLSPPSEPQSPSQTERNKLPNYKKKSRKSPAGSPHPPQNEQQAVFGMEPSGRDEVQSPAYSDISDDGAPVIETDMGDKNKSSDKKTETGQPLSHMPQYGMYPFYGQPPYMMPTVQQQAQESNKAKEQEKNLEKTTEKECKKESSEYQQKVIQQHYYSPYGYMPPGYPYNMDPNFGSVPLVPEDKIKEERIKESPSPADHNTKNPPIPNPIQVPTPGKIKTELSMKEKQQNENHQILKESIEIKSQMSPYLYSRQQQQQQPPPPPPPPQHGQREEDVRRFYVYPDQRRKSEQVQEQHNKTTPSKPPPPPAPSLKQKEKQPEEKKEKEIKHEGVKPTMETQGPPPPPTSQYAYIHPSYMQSPHYGALPFDPNHPVYRGIMVPGPYSGNPYLHPQLPRYHAPEDLSRPPPPTKALDMLQHHAQYYSSHKIHELQERAIKSPTPKTSVASSSPSGNNGVTTGQPQNQMAVTSQASGTISTGGKQTPGENKESRSPPPQRHVHTHHHTHVGLGYPMYPAPYGAAVLASQQAAAVTVINPYPPK